MAEKEKLENAQDSAILEALKELIGASAMQAVIQAAANQASLQGEETIIDKNTALQQITRKNKVAKNYTGIGFLRSRS